MNNIFHKIAVIVSNIVGSPKAFLFALFLIIFWGLSGPIFGFSDTWQLVINTTTTIITFLMVFLIQNTQNRDAKVVHLKLDELIKATKSARNELVDLEEMTDDQLQILQDQFKIFHEKSSQNKSGKPRI